MKFNNKQLNLLFNLSCDELGLRNEKCPDFCNWISVFFSQDYLLQIEFPKDTKWLYKHPIMNQMMKLILEERVMTGIETIVKMDMNIMKVIIGKEVAAVTLSTVVVVVIILEELMKIFIHQHMHQQNIVLVLVPILVIIIAEVVVTIAAVDLFNIFKNS